MLRKIICLSPSQLIWMLITSKKYLHSNIQTGIWPNNWAPLVPWPSQVNVKWTNIWLQHSPNALNPWKQRERELGSKPIRTFSCNSSPLCKRCSQAPGHDQVQTLWEPKAHRPALVTLSVLGCNHVYSPDSVSSLILRAQLSLHLLHTASAQQTFAQWGSFLLLKFWPEPLRPKKRGIQVPLTNPWCPENSASKTCRSLCICVKYWIYPSPRHATAMSTALLYNMLAETHACLTHHQIAAPWVTSLGVGVQAKHLDVEGSSSLGLSVVHFFPLP